MTTLIAWVRSHGFDPPTAPADPKSRRSTVGPSKRWGECLTRPAAARAYLPDHGIGPATLPGFGHTWHPDDLSIENYAALAGKLAADVGADVVAGHSLGANVALEMAAAGVFDGPIALLSPSFSREDEAKELGTMNSIGRVPGAGLLAWTAMLKVMPRAMKSKLPAESADVFAADLANNDPRFCRALVRSYYEYLDRHGSLVARLCDSGVKAVVAFGDDDEIGLTDAERRGLEASPNVSLVTISEATHFMVVEQPAQIAELICDLAGVALADRA